MTTPLNHKRKPKEKKAKKNRTGWTNALPGIQCICMCAILKGHNTYVRGGHEETTQRKLREKTGQESKGGRTQANKTHKSKSKQRTKGGGSKQRRAAVSPKGKKKSQRHENRSTYVRGCARAPGFQILNWWCSGFSRLLPRERFRHFGFFAMRQLLLRDCFLKMNWLTQLNLRHMALYHGCARQPSISRKTPLRMSLLLPESRCYYRLRRSQPTVSPHQACTQEHTADLVWIGALKRRGSSEPPKSTAYVGGMRSCIRLKVKLATPIPLPETASLNNRSS